MSSSNTDYSANLSLDQRRRIQELLDEALSLEGRWEQYGRTIGLAAIGESPAAIAKAAVRRRLTDLRRSLCEDPTIRTIAGSAEVGVGLNLAFMVTGKLVADKFHGVDVVQLGVLIAQLGVLRLCEESF